MDGMWFLGALFVVLMIVLALYMGEAIIALYLVARREYKNARNAEKIVDAQKETHHAEE